MLPGLMKYRRTGRFDEPYGCSCRKREYIMKVIKDDEVIAEGRFTLLMSGSGMVRNFKKIK